MDTFYLDENNNLIVNQGFILKSGIEAIKQDIKTLLLMFKGENPFNNTEGLEWYNLLNKNNLALIENKIRQRLLQDSRIKNIRALTLKNVNGKLTIEATLITTEGVLNV